MSRKTTIIISLVAGIMVFSASFAAQAASINLSSGAEKYELGKDFTVSILIDSAGKNFDTVRAAINFPASQLQVKSFTFGPNFTIPSGENGFDNTVGTLTYGAGIPEGLDKPAVFGTITLAPVTQGSASLSVSGDSLVLSAGENIFDGVLKTASFSFQKPAVEEQPKIQPQLPVKKPVADPRQKPEPVEVEQNEPIATETQDLTGFEAGLAPAVEEKTGGYPITNMYIAIMAGLGIALLFAVYIAKKVLKPRKSDI